MGCPAYLTHKETLMRTLPEQAETGKAELPAYSSRVRGAIMSWFAAVLALGPLTGCSIKQIAVKQPGNVLASNSEMVDRYFKTADAQQAAQRRTQLELDVST